MLPPKKSLGQHFLRDENIARKIVESLQLKAGDRVIEIGPGQGDLTKFLVRSSVHVVGIEIDPRAVEVLRERFGDGLQLVEQDILTVRLADVSLQQGFRPCVVGNLPYYITSEILFWLFDQRQFIRHATFMMQFEVAQRLVAQPDSKQYGILSIMTQFYTECRFLFKVSRNSFHPRPQVDSAVVRFEPKELIPSVDERLFRNVVRATFGTRRKTLRNGLRRMGFEEDRLQSLPFDLSQRPQQLPLAEFIRLTNLLAPLAEGVTLQY
jgi:16S rRNA (adenine1518-N6/adenine1519-N6)-dimethyltransferase